jgi:diguanylate cyclase (GGDEF)-like protein
MEITKYFKSYIGVPILQGSTAIGTVCAIDSVPYKFSDKQIELFQTIATYISNLMDLEVEIRKKERAERLLNDHNRVLMAIAQGAKLEDILEEICKRVEAHSGNVHCTISTYDASNQMIVLAAAPSLPSRYKQWLQNTGIEIGPRQGSCGTAAYRRELVVVSDIQQDDLWDDYREFAMKDNLHACWSIPIFSSKNKLLGTFALYYNEPKAPLQEEINLLDNFSFLAGIGIEKSRAEERIAFLAFHDELTQVPNRLSFQERSEAAFEEAVTTQSQLSIMIVDLDKFKDINDQYGHDYGDEVLRVVTKRIQASIPASGMLARLGGDEFALLFSGLERIELEDVASTIVQEAQKPISYQNQAFSVTISVGISMFPKDGNTVSELKKHADHAMYKAKENGKNGYAFY